jgi:asparagine synthase (glutamine-hydrolysing)
VCQVGEGADELFCGYPFWGDTLKAAPTIRRYQHLPLFLRQLLWRMMQPATHLSWKALRRLDVFRRVSSDQPAFWGGAEAYQETVKARFLSSSFKNRMRGYSSFEPIKKLRTEFLNDAPSEADDLHWMAYLDLRLRLPELLLMRVDKMTMATAVEARVPFLDQEFVRMAMSIPQSLKFRNKTLKYLLKKAVEPILPHEIIYRRKQGFGVPVNEWFDVQLKAWANKKVADFSERTDYFDPSTVKQFLNSVGSSSSWFLLNFVLWHEHWIERKEIDLPA